MLLYSIQLLSVWKSAQRIGYLAGGDGSRESPEFQRAYAWIHKQMSNRIAHFSGDYPVWAWVTRPDLRETGHLPSGAKGVLLTIRVPKSRVLVSDFIAWHFVLGDWYLPKPREKVDDVTTHNRSIGSTARVASWSQIFTPSRISRYYSAGDKLQACVDRVYLNEVVHVRHFTARSVASLGGRNKRPPPFPRLRAAYRLGRILWFIFKIAETRDSAGKAGRVVIFPFWNQMTSQFERCAETLRVLVIARGTLDKYAKPLKYPSKEIDASLIDLKSEITLHNPDSLGKAFTLGFYLVQMQTAIGESLNLKDRKTLARIRSDLDSLILGLGLERSIVANAIMGLKHLHRPRLGDDRNARFLQHLDGFFSNLNANTKQFRARV